MSRKTPQEKKRWSLLKDRRNTYGESSKGSRKSIPRRKRASSRGQRRIPKQVLSSAAKAPIEDVQEQVALRLLSHQTWAWKKAPDTPLGEVLERKLRRRVELGMVDPETAVRRKAKLRKRQRK